MTPVAVPLWQRPVLRDVAGDTLRPGGFRLTDMAAESMGLAPGWKVLDVGCGMGATVHRLRSRFGARAFGVDAGAEQVAQALAPGIVRARAENLPFAPGTFRAVFCECVLSLLDDVPATLGELHRILEPGGHLAVSDLYADRVESISEAGSSCAGGALSLTRLRAMLERQGFDIALEEDHSHLLRELAARLLFAAGEGAGCACDGRPRGYALIIARKRDDHV